MTHNPSRVKTANLCARVDVELVHRVDVLASRLDLSRSAMMERIVRNGVRDIEKAATIVGMPGINALMRLSVAFEDDPEQAAELKRVLDALRDHRTRDQPDLFGGVPA